MGNKWYHLTGQRFGRLLVLGDGESKPAKFGTRKFWRVRCDCGTEKQVISHGLVSGHTRSCGCFRKDAMRHMRGEKHHNWKGGRIITSSGYVNILLPDHPNANHSGYVPEHMAVMSAHLGRGLKKGETVHHRNGEKQDNRLENLELWSCSHSSGQRVEDKIKWCKEFLAEYDR